MKNILDRFRLDGRVAIVTGGSKGLGRSMAEGLASAGADLVLCSRNEEEAQAAARDIENEYSRRVLGVGCDVSVADDVDGLITATLDAFGKVDILVNNAGINARGAIDELPIRDFDAIVGVNLRGPWLGCRAVAPHMKKAGYGRVINISSALDSHAVAGRGPYAASKGGVSMITKTLALEWGPHGITCNAISPGPFLTPMNEPIADDEFTRKHLIAKTALDRWGEMHEIQGAVVFLASDASSYVTGSTVRVDAGWTAH